MPVVRYRSHEDARRDLARVRVSDLASAIRAVWARAALLAPPMTSFRGVQKFTSIEAAETERRQRLRKNS